MFTLVKLYPYEAGGPRATALVSNGGETTPWIVDVHDVRRLLRTRCCGSADSAAVAAVLETLEVEEQRRRLFELQAS
jgi:NhaP-type Na+/H+ and K+/H+ antiporter